MTTITTSQENFAFKLNDKSRMMCNYKKEGAVICNCCNPIMSCASSPGICQDCLEWLKKTE